MATPRIEDIIEVTCRNIGAPVTAPQIARIAAKAKRATGQESTLRVLENEIAKLQRNSLTRLIHQREEELATLKQHLAGLS